MRNILMTIQYDGTNFSGWQRQPGRRTVQGELERALTTVCGKPIQINGTSRTDAGVHAYGQRAGFRGEFGIPTDRMMTAVNNLLCGGRLGTGVGGDVQLTGLREVSAEFHPRFDAKGKKYIYRIRTAPEMDVFQKNYTYQLRTPLAIERMRQAAAYMVGTHDFKCFQAAGGEEKETTVRTIFDVELFCRENSLKQGDGTVQELEFHVRGDGFLYNMVRIIVGTLVDVGSGKLDPEALPDIIKSKERRNAGHTAPPQGLYLAEIYYENHILT